MSVRGGTIFEGSRDSESNSESAAEDFNTQHYVKLNEYTSESMHKPIQRYLVFHSVVIRVLVRVVGSCICVIPVSFLRWHLALFLAFVCALSTLGSALLIWWVGHDARERIQKLEFFRLYATTIDILQQHTEDQDDTDTDTPTSTALLDDQTKHLHSHAFDTRPRTGAAPRYIPRSVLDVGRFAFDTPFWGLLVPCIAELVTMILFGLACVSRILFAFDIPTQNSVWNVLILAPLPFYLACSSFILTLLFRPLDIMSAIQLNDKLIIYNEHGVVLHNRCMEQYERDIQYGGSFVEKWEPCTLQNRAVVLWDSIKDVTLALSLENAPFSTQPITLPWIYISTVNNIGKEYRVIVPIVPARTSTSSPLSAWIAHICRHWTFFNIAPVYDSLTTHDTIELLRVLQQRRPDFFDKADFLISDIENRLTPLGWSVR